MARPLLLTALALAGLGMPAGASPAAAPAACARWAAASGDDSANGSRAHPFLTSQRLVASLPDGGVGCLQGGSAFIGRVVVTHPVTLRTDGNGQAIVVGGVTIEPDAAGSTIAGLTIHGQGSARATVLVRGDAARIVGNTIDGSGYQDRNTACVLLDGVRGAVVDGNRIHTCTSASGTDLSAPGVFVGSAYGAQVTNNLIARTVGFGISLGPNAQHTRVAHNIVDAAAGGVLIDGNSHTASSYNVVQDNIFSNSGTWNVQASWGGVVGKGNAVVSNCVWHAAVGNIEAPGVALVDNIVANPHYAHRPTDYTITGGACVDKRPSFLTARLAALPRFTVRYRLRALAARVQFVSFQLVGVPTGAQVLVRCASGCSARWQDTVGGGTVSVPTLRGRWLRIGTKVDVLVSQTGRAGAWARVTVTGLPHGVSVAHACLAPGGSTPVSCSRYRR